MKRQKLFLWLVLIILCLGAWWFGLSTSGDQEENMSVRLERHHTESSPLKQPKMAHVSSSKSPLKKSQDAQGSDATAAAVRPTSQEDEHAGHAILAEDLDLGGAHKGARTQRSPSVPIAIGGVHGHLSERQTQLSYQTEGILAKLSMSLGYGSYVDEQQERHERMSGQYAMAVMLGAHSAVGVQWEAMPNAQDVSVMGVYYQPQTRLRLKGAANYLWSDRDFAFASGPQNRSVDQYGAFVSGHKVFAQEEQPWMHALGVSAWYTRAHERAQTQDSVWFVRDEGDQYLLSQDDRALSLGRLMGAALDTQFELHEHGVVRLGLGYEQLSYPFADGSSEYQRSLYQSVHADFEPMQHVVLGVDYKKGSSETRATLRGAYLGWAVSAYQYWGVNGTQGFKGVALEYLLGDPSDGAKASLSERMRARLLSGGQSLLHEAIDRPVALPLVLLAKVDNSYMTSDISVDKSGLPSDARVQVSGDLIVVTFEEGSTPYVSDVTMSAPDGTVALDNSTQAYARASGDQVFISIPSMEDSVGVPGDYSFYYHVDEGAESSTIQVNVNATAV